VQSRETSRFSTLRPNFVFVTLTLMQGKLVMVCVCRLTKRYKISLAIVTPSGGEAKFLSDCPRICCTTVFVGSLLRCAGFSADALKMVSLSPKLVHITLIK